MVRFARLTKRGIVVEWRKTVTSTNTVMQQELAKTQSTSPSVLVAERQTAGHGKLQRSFFSPAGSGIYVTIGLPLSFLAPGWQPQRLTICAAVAAFQAVRPLVDDQLTIKWVNDLYRGNKKAAGMLAETALDRDNKLRGVVVGWGININQSADWPPALQEVAGTIVDHPLTATERDDLVDVLVDRFLNLLRVPWSAVLMVYRDHQYLAGKSLTVQSGNSLVAGCFERIEDDGRLSIQTAGGCRSFASGTVRLQ
ncbi:biotin--[acetyl-CoA-carboxylase] ligase [uncultured Limosilactobacillus sp.]|uniref:biotin--[acetyl-CoA-carboxylase] ligase n=1 Tax=uncultured Limosilactobacillus sp. TaxID=2837629 RepID=UPI0025EE5888|nr:biotin--[acetyl-CoA-carboxylase] ligase [uncultured Limosilactobacillus sp.]